MALKYNNNQVNTVLWNGTKTTTSIDKTYSGSATSSTTAISGTYHWSGSITTDIKTNDISSLSASATSSSAWVSSIGNPSLSINSDGYVVVFVSGQTTRSGRLISFSVAITGSYVSLTGEVNKVLYNGQLVWLKPDTTLTDLAGSKWEFNSSPGQVSADPITFNIAFRSAELSFSSMRIEKLNLVIASGARIYYDDTLAYDSSATMSGGTPWPIIGASAGCIIHFNAEQDSSSDSTNSTLINYMYANATLII